MTDMINKEDTDLAVQEFKIKDLGKVNDYVYLLLDNGQNLLANREETYDISEFSSISGVFQMKERLVAILFKGNVLLAVDLKTKEILLEEDNAYDAYKVNDETLKVIMKSGGGKDNIYNINTKEYLSVPDGCEFDEALGNDLYVYKKSDNNESFSVSNLYCVVNSEGGILLDNIDGYIYLNDRSLIIHEKNIIKIIDIDDINNIKTVEKNNVVIAEPTYYDGMIVIIQKGSVELYTPDFELVKEILLYEVSEVRDYEIVNDTLKLWVPDSTIENDYGKHVFVNLKTGKKMSHFRMESFPYYIPKTYVGRDFSNSKSVNFHFYDENFNEVLDIIADGYEDLTSADENIFKITSGDECKIFNASNGKLKKVEYEYMEFHKTLPYGFGINYSNTMDFFDEDFNVIISEFNFEKYDLRIGKFKYFILNDYLCVISNFTDGYGQIRYRTIIEKADGEEILDSFTKQCYPMGTYIQIMDRQETKFLNTLTGEIGLLSLVSTVDGDGKVDISKVDSIEEHLVTRESAKQITDKNGSRIKDKRLIKK